MAAPALERSPILDIDSLGERKEERVWREGEGVGVFVWDRGVRGVCVSGCM